MTQQVTLRKVHNRAILSTALFYLCVTSIVTAIPSVLITGNPLFGFGILTVAGLIFLGPAMTSEWASYKSVKRGGTPYQH